MSAHVYRLSCGCAATEMPDRKVGHVIRCILHGFQRTVGQGVRLAKLVAESEA